MLSQKYEVKSIETVWVSHETAPGGYTLLMHVRDMSLMRPVLLNVPSVDHSAWVWRIAREVLGLDRIL